MSQKVMEGSGVVVAEPSRIEASTLVAQLGVDPAKGLSDEAAAERLAADGRNELPTTPPVPLWQRVLAQFREPLVYLLLAAVVISLAAWVVDGAEGTPVDPLVIVAIIVVNAVLGLTQEAKADNAVAALGSSVAATSSVLRDGALRTVLSAELVMGDVLALGEGDAVGADARLVSASALRVQESSLTGESEAVTKDAQTLPDAVALADRTNMVFRGTAVVQGVGRAVVTATGLRTELGAIAELLDDTVEEPTPLQNEIKRLSKLLGLVVVAIAIIVMVTIVLVNDITDAQDLVTVLLLGVSLAVAAVPEGLPTILSVVLAIGAQRMARRNAVVKRLTSVEALGSAGVICTDKTGTLTRNEMTIQRVLTASGRADVSGVGYRPDGDATSDGLELGTAHRAEAQLALRVGSLANNAQLSAADDEWTIQGDPTEAAFLVAAHKVDGTVAQLDRYTRTAEAPFTSERKMMSTLHRREDDDTTVLFSKGAPDVLLGKCTRQQVGDDVVDLTDEVRAALLAEVDALSAEAFRTLGVAYRVTDGGRDQLGDVADGSAERDLTYVGVVGIIDPPRVEVRAAIAEAHRAGIRVVMITGDHPLTAGRIASDLGIIEPGGRTVTGAELDGLDDSDLVEVTREASVYARVSPHHKLRLVDAFQADGRIVSMTGDGVNDAPALKSADIGVAMGIAGTEVTKEASRMILADDNFATIIAAVRQGRVIFDNIRKFLRYLLSSNMGEVLTVFLGVVFAGLLGLTAAVDGVADESIVLPLLATQILWINLITDSTPALAMGMDPEVDDVMARAPRGATDRAVDGRMWVGILSTGLVMALVTLLTIDVFLPGGLVDGSDTLDVARTAGFTTLVLAQLFNALNARSETASAVHGLFANRWLWGAIALSVVLQVAVVETPFLQRAFGTASLDLTHWLTCVALASGVLWFRELGKAVQRAMRRRGQGPRRAGSTGRVPRPPSRSATMRPAAHPGARP